MRTTTKMIQTVVIAILMVGFSVSAYARQVRLSAALANPVLMANKKQTTYLKIGLTGFEMEEVRKRTPVNIAIVIDKSGSMCGEKIRQAKAAALMAVNRLSDNDIVSVVAYNNTVSVLVPATRASDKHVIREGIRRLEAGGNTGLFAGVSKGAHEIRKFMSRERVNRVILLSDGLANVGPSTPGALGDLGASLRKEGISVTTLGLGLGYNEDLMTQLAGRSDGNHSFIEHPNDLARIFDKEFGDVLSVVAQELIIKIECADGVRPIRILGRDADIYGKKVVAEMNQLCSNQEKYVLLEVEVSASRANTTDDIAKVAVSYANMETQTHESLTSTVSVRFTGSENEVEQKTDRGVMVDAVKQVATERNILATKLRDEGKIGEAKNELLLNAKFLEKQGASLESEELENLGRDNRMDVENLAPERWQKGRKSMRSRQYKTKSQQTY